MRFNAVMGHPLREHLPAAWPDEVPHFPGIVAIGNSFGDTAATLVRHAPEAHGISFFFDSPNEKRLGFGVSKRI